MLFVYIIFVEGVLRTEVIGQACVPYIKLTVHYLRLWLPLEYGRIYVVSDSEGLDIPEFLKIDAATRKAAWAGRSYTDPRTGGTQEAWRVREEERRRGNAETKKLKNAAAFERMKAKHPGEVYNRSMKLWVVEPKGE